MPSPESSSEDEDEDEEEITLGVIGCYVTPLEDILFARGVVFYLATPVNVTFHLSVLKICSNNCEDRPMRK